LDIEKYMLPCMNKSLFGVDCMGCGTQRSFLLLINGEFTKAFYQFPAIYTTLIFLGFLGLHFIDKSRDYHKIIIGMAITNAFIMIIAYIYKITNL
jgi:hypothetical protein